MSLFWLVHRRVFSLEETASSRAHEVRATVKHKLGAVPWQAGRNRTRSFHELFKDARLHASSIMRSECYLNIQYLTRLQQLLSYIEMLLSQIFTRPFTILIIHPMSNCLRTTLNILLPSLLNYMVGDATSYLLRCEDAKTLRAAPTNDAKS